VTIPGFVRQEPIVHTPAVAFRDAINFRAHLRRGEKGISPPVHRRAPGMRRLPVKSNGVPLDTNCSEDRA